MTGRGIGKSMNHSQSCYRSQITLFKKQPIKNEKSKSKKLGVTCWQPQHMESYGRERMSLAPTSTTERNFASKKQASQQTKNITKIPYLAFSWSSFVRHGSE